MTSGDATWIATLRSRATAMVGPRPSLRTTLRHGAIMAGLLFAVWLFVFIAPSSEVLGGDARAYWLLNLSHPYALIPSMTGAFTYTPIAAIAFSPFGLLPWPVFWSLWMAALIATLVWLGGRKTLLLLAFPPVAIELFYGNINLLIAAAIVLGFRYPSSWVFVAATKVTPVAGMAWFAARREWRPLLVVLGLWLALALLSYLFMPRLWEEWLASMLAGRDAIGDGIVPVPLLVRLPIAVMLAAWGGVTDRRWTVPVAATISLPVVFFGGLSILAAIAAVDRPEPRRPRVDPGAPQGLEAGTGTA